MDEPYIGEIHPISFGFAPKGWAFCAGQLLPINQNQALFSLLGTAFGGNGVTTFALPDLRGRVPVGTGAMPGGGSYVQGQTGGLESVTLLQQQMPLHNHPFTGTLQTSADQDEASPNQQLLATGTLNQFSDGPANTTMGGMVSGNVVATGANQGHENRQPYIGLNYVIALQGIFPSRS